MHAALILSLSLVLLAGCTSRTLHADGSASYRYGSIDFSGASWSAEQRRCAARAAKPAHLGTECGFWTCTSRYACVPAHSDQSSVAQ